MASNSLNNINFYFLCTNYASNKDGIGHYTSKIVNELVKNKKHEVFVFTKNTYHLSRLKLFFSLKMTKKTLSLMKQIKRSSSKGFIIIEYPFVEYNPLFLLVLLFLKFCKKKNNKIVLSLHEYSRTKKLRKAFIKLIVPLSDILLYTREEDVSSLNTKNIQLKKRIIPANIEPTRSSDFKIKNGINICFFGILNFETKEINNMLKSWELNFKELSKQKINFHLISSTYNQSFQENEYIKYHYNLNDKKVSDLLQEMHFLILPLKPEVSINNGSLAVGCIHRCIPVGVFSSFFDDSFGLKMIDYSIDEFTRIYNEIICLDREVIKNKVKLAYQYGKEKSVSKAADLYLNISKS